MLPAHRNISSIHAVVKCRKVIPINGHQRYRFRKKYAVQIFHNKLFLYSGSVSYADFTNYLITLETSSESTTGNISKLLSIVSQSGPREENDNDTEYYHRDSVDCLVYVHKPCRCWLSYESLFEKWRFNYYFIPSMVVSGGRDGLIGLWNSHDLKLIKRINYKDKNSVFQVRHHLVNNLEKLKSEAFNSRRSCRATWPRKWKRSASGTRRLLQEQNFSQKQLIPLRAMESKRF